MGFDFEIVTDSSCNLSESYINKYNLHVMSLFYNTSTNEYRGYTKGEEFDYKKFYNLLKDKESITTSLISLEDCETTCRAILSSGKDLIYIGFSSGLSGTYNTGAIVLEELKEEFPDRKIFHIDTLSAALGQGLLVHKAALLREEGQTIEQVNEWVTQNMLKVCHWVAIDDLFFLKRGGRISATAAIGGALLSIKPIVHVDNEGKLVNVMNARGRKKSLDVLIEKMKDTMTPKSGQTIYISHGDCLDDAKYVENKIRENFDVEDVIINLLEPVIASHSGPGTMALFFLGDKR